MEAKKEMKLMNPSTVESIPFSDCFLLVNL